MQEPTPTWYVSRQRPEELFGKRVREEREAKGWSQQRLADTLRDRGMQLDATAITRIEGGKGRGSGGRSVRLDEAAALADALGVSLDRLLLPSVESDPLDRLEWWERYRRDLQDRQDDLDQEWRTLTHEAEEADRNIDYWRRMVAEARRRSNLPPVDLPPGTGAVEAERLVAEQARRERRVEGSEGDGD